MPADDVAAWVADAVPAPPAAVPARTRWEHRWRAQLLVFIALVAVAAPLLPGLAAPAESSGLASLAWLVATPLRRQLTGAFGGAVILAQLSFALRRRRATAGASTWGTLHKLLALALVPFVLLHTAGQAGIGANRLLLGTLLALVLVAQAGHVVKAFAHDRVHAEGRCPTARMRRFEQQTNANDGVVHSLGHLLHVALATAVALLLLFHVLSVYYF